MTLVKTPIVTDSFTDTDGTFMTAHHADTGQLWANLFTGYLLTIQSNQMTLANGVGDGTVRITGDAGPGDIYFQFTLVDGSFSRSDFDTALTITCAKKSTGEGGTSLFFNYTVSTGDTDHIISLGSLSQSHALSNGDVVYVVVHMDGTAEIYVNSVLILSGSTGFSYTALQTNIVDLGITYYDSGSIIIDSFELGHIADVTAPPADPTNLLSACTSGIGEPALPQAPGANFTMSVGSGVEPLTVIFTDTSTNTPTSWLWEFGDGTTATTQNPTHAFSAGIWPVRLTATNAYGSSSYQQTLVVTSVSPPPPGIPAGGISSLLGLIGYYVVDTPGNQVKIYDTNSGLLRTFGSVGNANGKFFNPTTCSIVNGRQLLDRVVINQN